MFAKIKKKLMKTALILGGVLVLGATNASAMQEKNQKIINVPYINQSEIVSGCEAVSATMLLQFFKYDISAKEFTDNYLIKQDWKVKNGKQYGADPNEVYVGNPYIASGENCGYGCYSKCIERSVNKFLQSFKDDKMPKRKAESYKGIGLNDIIKQYIDKDIPVLVWATMNMLPSYSGNKWIIEEMPQGKADADSLPTKVTECKTEREFVWTAREHCMVLVGYDEENYIFNDPYKNNGIVKYRKDLVETRFNELGSQFVVIKDKKPEVALASASQQEIKVEAEKQEEYTDELVNDV